MPRIELLKPARYAREEHRRGALLVVDDGTAAKWIHGKIAKPAAESSQLPTSCPRCGVLFEIPREPAADERWVACPNARCGGFGWYR
jgi:hypothetical protein